MDESHLIDTALGALAVRVVGEGPPALLWHSLFVDERSWDRMVTSLARTRRLVIVTGPGHGRSGDPRRRYSIDECVEAAGAVLDNLGVTDPVDWVGNAWGGHVGITFAARWPERCRTLVAVGAPVAALTPVERARTYLLLAAYRVLGPGRLVVGGITDVLVSPRTRSTDPDAVSLIQDCLRTADRRQLTNAVVSISLHRPDLTALLGQLSVPTLIVTGADHHVFTPDQARTAAGKIAGGQVAVVDDAAFLIPLESPDTCTRLLLEFWTDHPPRSPR